MTSLGSNVANFRDSACYEYGDTVFFEGQVYILNAVPGSIPPYVPGVPPYPGDGIWFNPAGSVIPPVIAPEPFTTFQQTGANWDAEKNYGTVSFSWSGGLPNKGLTLIINGSGITSPLGYYIDEDTNTGSIYGIGPGEPGTTISVQIKALGIGGSGGDTTSSAVPMTTLGKPPAPTIELVDYSINPDTSKGEVAIKFQTNASLYNVPTSINGYAIGSTNTSGQPDFTFVYDFALGTATFSELTNFNGIVPPLSFKIFIEGSNSAGVGAISNIIEKNFNPRPPLPDNLNNIAIVTFLLGDADYSVTGNWSINTSGNQQIGSYNCHTGAFTEPVAGETVKYLQALQSRGVSVLLSLGGASWNVATGLSSGSNLALNIASAFFGVGASPNGWIRYGSTLTPPNPFIFDGLDLDWEGAGTATGTEEINFLTQFRAVLPETILSMAPQPPYNANAATFPSAFTANGQYSPFPTATSAVSTYVANNPAHPALFDFNHLGYFDYIFVQYYNNPDWAPGSFAFAPNVAQFAKMCQFAIPHRDNAGPGLLGTRFVLGLAITDSTTAVYNGEDDNRFIQEALVQAQLSIGAPTVQNWCAGSGFWNSPLANYPDATNGSNPFNQLYNSDTGVVALAETQIIMMYCNASGNNPQWQTLPLLDFEEPGEPDIPPLTFTLSSGIPPAPYNVPSIVITLTNPPAGIIDLQIRIAQIDTINSIGTSTLEPIPVLTSVGNVYYIANGLQNTWFYELEIKGLLAIGTSQPATGRVQYAPGNQPFYSVDIGQNGSIIGPTGTVGGRMYMPYAFPPPSGNPPDPNTVQSLVCAWVSDTPPVFGANQIPINFRLVNETITPQQQWVTEVRGNPTIQWARNTFVQTPFAPTQRVWFYFSYASPNCMGAVGQVPNIYSMFPAP